jgi:hypothetical protein
MLTAWNTFFYFVNPSRIAVAHVVSDAEASRAFIAADLHRSGQRVCAFVFIRNRAS